jgi:antitoxin component of RelBE/YafQ-DinJ toxin-antitoxin module
MRTTVRIDDDVLNQLKRQAQDLGISLTKMLDRVLRKGLSAPAEPRAPYRQKTYSMGVPRIDLDQVSAFVAAEEDAEILRKLAARK